MPERGCALMTGSILDHGPQLRRDLRHDPNQSRKAGRAWFSNMPSPFTCGSPARGRRQQPVSLGM